MKAVVLPGVGADLEPAEVPAPEPVDGQVVMRVRACGINFLDVLIRSGNYPAMPEFPAVLGSEVAGEVDGRRMIALPRGGGFAEECLVDADALVPLPDGATFAEGAAFLMTYLTSWIPLTRQVRVEAGDVAVVHAAAGGVGSAAMQLLRHLGASVVATAGSERKRAWALENGADEAYSYEEFADNVRADVVIDPVGGAIFAASTKALKPLGSVVAIGYAAGMWEDVNPALIVGRNASVHGFYLGRLMGLEPGIVREAIGELVALWEQGAIKPYVGAELPLDRAGDALRLIENREHIGKVVLVP